MLDDAPSEGKNPESPGLGPTPGTSMASPTSAVTVRLQVLGLLPLAFFADHAFYYYKSGGLGNVLWMCTLANLMLGVALLMRRPLLIRLAVIWLIPGLPLWIYYCAVTGNWLLTSVFTHVGGLAVGLVALGVVRSSRRTWLHGFAWYLILQQVSRMVTAPELNVNVAHSVYEGWEKVFSTYWQYWLAITVSVAVGLWVVGLILLKLFPPPSEGRVAQIA